MIGDGSEGGDGGDGGEGSDGGDGGSSVRPRVGGGPSFGGDLSIRVRVRLCLGLTWMFRRVPVENPRNE